MAFSIFDSTIPVYRQGLTTLLHLLDKLESHCQAQGTDSRTMLDAKLAEDMFDFKRQIQIACDFAKGGAMRLSGQEVPSHPDSETTVEELRSRIRTVLALLDSVHREQFEGAENREIKMSFPWGNLEFPGARFVTYWSLPNFFFHVTTAYNILRHAGVEIGKKDFLGE